MNLGGALNTVLVEAAAVLRPADLLDLLSGGEGRRFCGNLNPSSVFARLVETVWHRLKIKNRRRICKGRTGIINIFLNIFWYFFFRHFRKWFKARDARYLCQNIYFYVTCMDLFLVRCFLRGVGGRGEVGVDGRALLYLILRQVGDVLLACTFYNSVLVN